MLWSIKSNTLKNQAKVLLRHILTCRFSSITKLIRLWVFEEFFKEPNCFLSILFLIELNDQSDTNDSQILDKVGVNEIGRRSVVTCAGTDVLRIGITSAFFHTVGTCCCCIKALNSEATGKAKIRYTRNLALRTQLGMPSEPNGSTKSR